MSFFDLIKESAIHVRFRPGWEAIGKSGDGASCVVRGTFGETPPLGSYAPEFESGNQGLAAGTPLAALRDAVIQNAGAQQAATYMLLLQRLARFGLIEFPLVDSEGEHAVALPQWNTFTPALASEVPCEGRQLTRFACLRREDGVWLLEAPLCGSRFAFTDLAALDTPLVRRALAAAGFLEAGETGARGDALTQWEFHDLLFHGHSRMGWHQDPVGAMFPFIGEIAPPPAARPPWPGERISLARASNDVGAEGFAEVLERRRSERFYDESHPISLLDLGALLDRAARVRWIGEVQVSNLRGRTSPFEISRRPYPNGGASYELEIYPVVDRCVGLDSGFYHYDAGTHELVRLSGRTPEVERMLTDAKVATAGQSDPQIVLTIAARFARVMWKYRSISYAVILRNAGALYQTLYLAATERGLSPCGIGCGDAALFAAATGLDPMIEGTVGDFILGGRPYPS
jgi:SagB-type dehydrogenase family enzyme